MSSSSSFLPSSADVDAVSAAVLLVRDVAGQYRPAHAEEVLKQARWMLAQRLRRGATLSSPQVLKDFLSVELGTLEHEVFCVLFLDVQHRVITLKPMFRGAVTQTSAYLREVVKEVLRANAAAAQPSLGFDGAESRRRVTDPGR